MPESGFLTTSKTFPLVLGFKFVLHDPQNIIMLKFDVSDVKADTLAPSVAVVFIYARNV
jgi:hypothetical protein